jgi:hypothetical protein
MQELSNRCGANRLHNRAEWDSQSQEQHLPLRTAVNTLQQLLSAQLLCEPGCSWQALVCQVAAGLQA